MSAARQGSGHATVQLCLQPVLITLLFIILVRLYALQVCGDEENVTQNFFFASFVGNCEIDLEIKRYFCRAGVQSIQVSFFLFQSSKIFHALFKKKVAKLLLTENFFEVKYFSAGPTWCSTGPPASPFCISDWLLHVLVSVCT